jgi:hypothetical protein
MVSIDTRQGLLEYLALPQRAIDSKGLTYSKQKLPHENKIQSTKLVSINIPAILFI